jgi:opacity protein-like surface antigen
MKHCFHSGRKNTLSKKLIAMFFCAAVPISTCIAADDVTPSIELNSKAMLFSFSGLSVLGAGAFNGGFGGKYFIMNSMALRGSLQFLTASQSTPANPTGTDGSSSVTQLGLSAMAEYHLLKTRVSPYVGGGLSFSSTSTTDKAVVNGPGAQTTIKNGPVTLGGVTYSGGLNFGINALAGVEFFITKDISLAAEYMLGYSLFSRYDLVAGATTTNEGSLSSFGISASGLLTLAFYF